MLLKEGTCKECRIPFQVGDNLVPIFRVTKTDTFTVQTVNEPVMWIHLNCVKRAGTS